MAIYCEKLLSALTWNKPLSRLKWRYNTATWARLYPLGNQKLAFIGYYFLSASACSWYIVTSFFIFFRLPNLFTSFMSVPRLYRPRACRKDAAAEPPPTMGSSRRSLIRFNIKSFSAFILLLTSLLPQAVWAADEVANPSASSVLLPVSYTHLTLPTKRIV